MAKIDSLFEELMAKGGSDLHLEQGQKPKIRLHGKLEELGGQEIFTEESISELLKEIASEESWNHFIDLGDLDFAYALGHEARFRANYFRHFFGYGAIFRLIPSKILTLDELGMPEVLKGFAQIRSGLILITGPTGSGKSTTLAAIIDHINTIQNKKIITIEEPVEFMHTNKSCLITHREVGLDTQSFASGLKGAIKSDANIILVGEMRDQETIRLALKAAEMGILVFGTLHTNSAGKTIDRVVDVFPTNQKNQIRTTLANTLRSVVAQQLLRSADGSGRHSAYEILMRTSALSSIIMSGETMRLISEIQLNRQKGMILMDDCLRQLVQDGKVTQDEAYMKALDKAAFMR
ncbi:Twitching motility protein PilT [hydrothermal vent metagenome]|uniref:Twitching motility protein PilT n=1 Tax=hydrothermal vent metagenome TaxID=652676 RepID=A0A3B1D9C0_9ZZZZ